MECRLWYSGMFIPDGITSLVYEGFQKANKYVRSGKGPICFDWKCTYRWLNIHLLSPGKYRTRSEDEERPIENLVHTAQNHCKQWRVRSYQAELKKQWKHLKFAEESPFPPLNQLLKIFTRTKRDWTIMETKQCTSFRDTNILTCHVWGNASSWWKCVVMGEDVGIFGEISEHPSEC